MVDTTPDDLAAMSRHHNAVMVRTAHPRDDLEASLRRVGGVAEVERIDGGDGRSATFALFPQHGQAILPEVTRFLEEQRIPVDEVYAQRGRVDEVFREVTLGSGI